MAKAADKKVCFVITPIGDDKSEIRRHIDGIIEQSIEPALGEKYKIVAAHKEYAIGSINDRVIKSVIEADLVIANLTNTNPNVMYELAIRHSFGKPVIVIAEEGTKLPFDVVVENTIFYVNDPKGANELKEKLIEYEKPIDPEKKEYGPVYNVVNKIPLYNEVESGKGVSSERLAQYVINRLDSLEENMNFKWQNNTSIGPLKNLGKRRLMVYFYKNEPFEENEVSEIVNIFRLYDAKDMQIDKDNSGKNFEIYCTLTNIELRELVDNLDQRFVSKKNVSYNVIYGNPEKAYIS